MCQNPIVLKQEPVVVKMKINARETCKFKIVGLIASLWTLFDKFK